MSSKRIGEPLPLKAQEERASEKGTVPGLGWKVSDETRRKIEEIEENRRDAEYHSIAIMIG